MTIANALRARGLVSSATTTINSQQIYGTTQIAGGSAAPSPIRVKRKYTKRKAVTKPVAATPRKRFKSNPTPPVGSPISSTMTTPLSAGVPSSGATTPDLTALFKSSSGRIPSVVIDDGTQKPASFTATRVTPKVTDTSLGEPLTSTKNFNIPSSAILGASVGVGSTNNEPMVAYRVEDYLKRFVATSTAAATTSHQSKPTISIEELLQSPGPSYLGGPSSNVQLYQLGQQSRPQVHVTAASTVATHIHQLLANMSKSATPTISSVPSTQIVSPSHSTPTKSTSLSQPDSSGGGNSVNFTPLQLSQSGSPLQNSVPTLMSSLNKSCGFNMNNIIKIITSTSALTDTSVVRSLDGSRSSSVGHKLQLTDAHSTLLNTTNAGDMLDSSAQTSFTPANNTPISSGMGQLPKSLGQSSAINLTKTDQVFSHMMSSIPVTRISVSPDRSSLAQSGATGLDRLSSPLPGVTQVGRELPATIHDYQARPISIPDEETLGKVSSLLESSPVTEKPTLTSVKGVPSQSQRSHGVNVSVVTGYSQKPPVIRNASPTITSYSVTPKQSLATLAATRTRRIRTPKQFDL